MTSLEDQFKEASEHFGKVHKTFPDKAKLKMYGLYNQAVNGDVTGSAPSRMEAVKYAKYSAWKKCSGMPKKVAMKRYISELRARDDSFKISGEALENASGGSEQLNLDFASATKFVKAKGMSGISKKQNILLYAYFKQATDGVCTRAKPGRFATDQKKRGWKAWAGLYDMERSRAKELYLELVLKAYPSEKLSFQSLAQPSLSYTLRKDFELEKIQKEDNQMINLLSEFSLDILSAKLKKAIDTNSDIVFITGSSGFIGKHFLDLVLNYKHYSLLHSFQPVGMFGRYMDQLKYGKDNEHMGLQGKYPLVLCFSRESSKIRLIKQILDRNGKDAADKVIIVPYSLDQDNFGLSKQVIDLFKKFKFGSVNKSSIQDENREKVRLFHFAAKYSLTEGPEENKRSNVEGTKCVIDFCINLGIKLEYVSSVVVAGDYNGMFLETSFDEGQEFRDPYSESKYLAEKLVRDTTNLKYTIYRPGVVVGHSVTGEADKIDGPYFFFKALQSLRTYLPDSFILPLIDGETMPIVPVDYVARSIFHLGLNTKVTETGFKTFHLVDSSASHTPETLIDTLNMFAKAAHAPTFSAKLNTFILSVVPTKFMTAIQNIPILRSTPIWLAKNIFNIPVEALNYALNTTTYDDSDATVILGAAGIKCPSLRDYAQNLWDYYERRMDLATIDPKRALIKEIKGKNVLITGATDGIGLALAHNVAVAGANVLIVGRNEDKLQKCIEEITASSTGGFVRGYRADLSLEAETNEMIEEVLKENNYVDILINNAGRSIRRSVEYQWKDTGRFHDFERTMSLNYFGALRCILGFMPVMRDRRQGQIINISSIGAATNQARFASYAASKSALDGFSRCVAPECAADNVHLSTVYMPLVRTRMIESEGNDYTSRYGSLVLTLEEACDLICEAIIKKQRTVAPLWVRVVQAAYQLFPGVVESINTILYQLEPERAPKGLEESARANGDKEQLAAIVGLFKGGWK